MPIMVSSLELTVNKTVPSTSRLHNQNSKNCSDVAHDANRLVSKANVAPELQVFGWPAEQRLDSKIHKTPAQQFEKK